eukprot:CAMPEP_0197483388 /NCGR_PEP_ID=MMETSP1309-20131121/56773_1 /TAXON_ID=464262 /ORGANISM="Genus nov. species nov., Strain RCC998" /LENGTH=476 /DNA_ID=CAMNT_0043025989 /DNA_START=364 /DNA_END=1794 /DNA_ORIENTATION=-
MVEFSALPLTALAAVWQGGQGIQGGYLPVLSQGLGFNLDSSSSHGGVHVPLGIQVAVLILVWNLLGGGILLACQLTLHLLDAYQKNRAEWINNQEERAKGKGKGKGKGMGMGMKMGMGADTKVASSSSSSSSYQKAVDMCSRVFYLVDFDLPAFSFSALSTLGLGRKPVVKAHRLEPLGMDAYLGKAHLDDLKRRIEGLDGAQGEGKQEEGNWKHLSQKQSSQLSSHQWVCSNDDDRLCDFQSSGLQMLVKTVFEDVEFDDVRKFWIDDNFRANWDKCFVSSEKVLEFQPGDEQGQGQEEGDQDSASSGEIVRWVRKFPAFCSPREYIIARKSFYEEDTRTAYVISKSVDYDLPPKIKRVKEYYSSWRIRVVPSAREEGKWAVETMLLHYEDLGFPNSIFKLAMRTFFGWFITGLESNGLREYVKCNGTSTNRSTSSNSAGSKGNVGKAATVKGRPLKRWQMLSAFALVLMYKKFK